MATPSMSFSGKSLELLQYALELAQAEIHNQLGSCPDPHEYADELDQLEDDRAAIDRLHARITKKLDAPAS